MNVRRLAAIDMWGTKGTLLRRRIILAEFLIGVAGAFAIGIWSLTATHGAGGTILGLWLIGIGLNYVPLAAYALRLSGAGVLERELKGVDTLPELRRYGVRQFWIFLPLALVVFTVRDEMARRAAPR
jgi:hypothetical protein